MKRKNIVLASGSPFRRAMLSAAGLQFDVVVPEVDENAAKRAMLSETPPPSPGEVAGRLAALKAAAVSAALPERVVVGSDQVLAFEGKLFSKPQDLSEARRQLLRFRGRTHTLQTAVAIAENGAAFWTHVETARMTMRNFSESFLDSYIERQGPRLLATVGAYEIEGPGIQLFDHIDGDHFTIVGLPLLPLLAELRRRDVLPD